jgi:C-terminal processing protease CtpA/Prc
MAPTRFYATFKLDEVRGVAHLGDILTDIVNHLKAAPGTQVTLELEVRAANEAGFNVQTVRVVTENSRARGSTNAAFEA